MLKDCVRILLGGASCLLLLNSSASPNLSPGLADVSPAEQFETRCGWFDNPTPQNFWLYDKDGEWVIGEQGGYQVEGDWEWPDFKKGQWVVTNAGGHGYGCACLQLRVNEQSHEVEEIKSARPRPLVVCRRDQGLKRWRKMFK